MGRFASADSIVPSPANPQSHNRYTYVLGNPLGYVDPSGHGICDPDGNCQGQSSTTSTTAPSLPAIPQSAEYCVLYPNRCEYVLSQLRPEGIEDGTWDTYKMLFYHLLGTPYLLPDGRIDDQYLIAVLIEIEIFDALIEETGTVYNAALEAVSYQYHNRYCKGSCPSLKEQLEWMDGMQAWREREGRPLPNPARSMPDAAKAIAGYNDGDGFQALWWANPYRGSEMANYINENHGDVPYQGLIVDGSEFIVGFRGREDDPLTSDEEGVLDFVVVTKEQDDACNITKPTCMGFP